MSKNIINISLIVVSVLVLLILAVLIWEGVFMKKTYLEPWSKEYYKNYTDKRTQLISHGILAANGHNLQNWKFVYPEDNRIDMYIDTDRLANNVDPLYTQAIISQGTLYEYMSISGDELGYKTDLQLYPDGDISSSEDLDQKRIATVTVTTKTPVDNPLYENIFKPDTSRLQYKAGVISEDILSDLTNTNDFEDLNLIYFSPESDKYTKINEYVLESAKVETGVDRIMEESQVLFRINEREKNKYRYGFSLEGSSMPEFNKHLLQSLLTVFPGMNTVQASIDSFMSQIDIATKENSGFFIITTNENNRVNQFNTGRLYSRVQLTAHKYNLALQPVSQAIEEYEEMSDIYSNIHRDLVSDDETILMLFRIGEPIGDTSLSMRKDVMDFIK